MRLSFVIIFLIVVMLSIIGFNRFCLRDHFATQAPKLTLYEKSNYFGKSFSSALDHIGSVEVSHDKRDDSKEDG